MLLLVSPTRLRPQQLIADVMSVVRNKQKVEVLRTWIHSCLLMPFLLLSQPMIPTSVFGGQKVFRFLKGFKAVKVQTTR